MIQARGFLFFFAAPTNCIFIASLIGCQSSLSAGKWIAPLCCLWLQMVPTHKDRRSKQDLWSFWQTNMDFKCSLVPLQRAQWWKRSHFLIPDCNKLQTHLLLAKPPPPKNISISSNRATYHQTTRSMSRLSTHSNTAQQRAKVIPAQVGSTGEPRLLYYLGLKIIMRRGVTSSFLLMLLLSFFGGFLFNQLYLR